MTEVPIIYKPEGLGYAIGTSVMKQLKKLPVKGMQRY